MKKLAVAVVLVVTAISVSGCIYAPYPGYGRGGWCYYHPYRCY